LPAERAIGIHDFERISRSRDGEATFLTGAIVFHVVQ
jgi:hypothetical protein